MRFISQNKHLITACCCAGALLFSSCRSAAYKAAISGDATAMQELVDDGSCLTEKNAMAVAAQTNGLITLGFYAPVFVTALAWDLGTLFCLGNFSLLERVIVNNDGAWQDYPINAAMINGHTEVVKVLFNAGQKPHAQAIQKAASNNSVDIIRMCIDYKMIGPNWQYNDWPLIMWSARDEAPNVTQLLISRGAFVNYRDDKGRTPLYLAAWNDNVLDARCLIAAGADIHTVLNLANNNADADKCVEIVRTLVKAGAPKSAFASHYLFGQSDSTLSIAISNAGAGAEPPAPPPAPKVTAPKRKVDSIMTKAKKRKPTPAKKAVPKPAAPKPAPKPQKPTSSSILQDFT